MLEFPSIVGAIEAAVAMQMLMAERTHHLPAERIMRFRMGIHMGGGPADPDPHPERYSFITRVRSC